jgi:peptidoglycan/LPS O-acetylase OafA/YrhL
MVTGQEESFSAGRIEILDGWRGIAISLVLFDHIAGTILQGAMGPLPSFGQHGVTMFFVLSGFLITSKLLEKKIDLKQFYVRRFFRLMPVAWTYLGGVLIVEFVVRQPLLQWGELASCVFFFRNYLGPVGLSLQFWSLSIEEQFYLLWPGLLLLAGPRRAKWVAALGAVGCAAYRLAHWNHYNVRLLSLHSEVRADALLIGCLLALFLADETIRARLALLSRLLALPALITVVFCIVRLDLLPPLVECVSLAVLIGASVLHRQSLAVRPLSNPCLTWLGRISYSLYIWNMPFFLLRTSPTGRMAMMFAMSFFVLCSHYMIERPMIALGRRLTNRDAQDILLQEPMPAETAYSERPLEIASATLSTSD